MRKEKLLYILLFTPMILTSCLRGGGEMLSRNESIESAESQSEIKESSKSKGTSSKISKTNESHVHTFDESVWINNAESHWHPSTCGHNVKVNENSHGFKLDPEKTKYETCTSDGAEYWECEVCKFAKYVYADPLDHSFELLEEVTDEGNSIYEKCKCHRCGQEAIYVKAFNWIAIEGSIRESSESTGLKFSRNGDYATYSFNLYNNFSGYVALNGEMDYWKDGANDTQNRSFFSTKNSTGLPNFSIEINGNEVEVDNTLTYEEMGLRDDETRTNWSTCGICRVGNCFLNKGLNTLKYTRTESYNMYVLGFYFIGEFSD